MGLKQAFFEINRAPSQTCYNIEDLLSFTYTESFVIPGTLFSFFNLEFDYFFEFFTILTFACNFNLSAGNLGLFEKSSIYFIRSIVNSV